MKSKCSRIGCKSSTAPCTHTQTGLKLCIPCARKTNQSTPGLVLFPPRTGKLTAIQRLILRLIAKAPGGMNRNELYDAIVWKNFNLKAVPRTLTYLEAWGFLVGQYIGEDLRYTINRDRRRIETIAAFR